MYLKVMHVVGFYHEHERWDRDSYIDIIWQNIDKNAMDQFGKVDLSKTSYYGQPYGTIFIRFVDQFLELIYLIRL
jgi:astacin